jgi:hypothetical protein
MSNPNGWKTPTQAQVDAKYEFVKKETRKMQPEARPKYDGKLFYYIGTWYTKNEIDFVIAMWKKHGYSVHTTIYVAEDRRKVKGKSVLKPMKGKHIFVRRN